MHHDPHFQDRTVVITGASAGVGRATVRGFARRGAKLGLIARDSDGLREATAEAEAIGATALALPADVADAEAVFAAARTCERELGDIDVWINNAMVTVFSPVAALTPEEVRRVTDVCYLGYVHGTMAALGHMRPRDRGVIVQVGSSLAYRGIPLQAAYCGAKHAIRGFTDSLRGELLHDGSNVAVTAVHLPAINTPQFDWARAHLDQAPRPVPPVYAPQTAAQAIMRAAKHPRREYWLGGHTLLIILANMLAPGLLDRHLAETAVDGQLTGRAIRGARRDNLFHSVAGGHRTDGAFTGEARGKAVAVPGPQTRLVAALAGGLLAAAIALAGKRAFQDGRR